MDRIIYLRTTEKPDTIVKYLVAQNADAARKVLQNLHTLYRTSGYSVFAPNSMTLIVVGMGTYYIEDFWS